MSTYKVMACPKNSGKHPLHDSRWIVSGDAEVEWNHDETEWRLKDGFLVCEMRDIQNQAEVAKLFSSAPELLAALEALLEDAEALEALRKSIFQRQREHFTPSAKIAQARAVVSKARGEA